MTAVAWSLQFDGSIHFTVSGPDSRRKRKVVADFDDKDQLAAGTALRVAWFPRVQTGGTETAEARRLFIDLWDAAAEIIDATPTGMFEIVVRRVPEGGQ